MSKYTLGEKLREIEREVKFRRSVYARMVAEHRMLREEADRRIAIMQEIATDYREQCEQEQPVLQFPRGHT